MTATALMVSLPLSAEIYKYRNAEGLIIFSDKPLKGGYKLMWRSRNIGESGSRPPPGISKPGYTLSIPKSMKKPKSKAAGVVKKTPKGNWDPAKYKLKVARYTPLIDQAASEVRLRPELLHALIRAESGYNASAVSKKGAVGLMQLMPGTARRYGVTNLYDPEQNIMGGARYLREMLELFNFDLRLALAAYNSGENAVIQHGDRIPPFPETQNYVKKVLKFYMENRMKTAEGEKMAGGDGPKILGDIN